MSKYNDICDGCMHKDYCDMAQFGGHNPRITACSKFAKTKQTNADKIRQMSDEELVEAWYYIYHNVIFASTNSRQGLLDWLKQEVG